MRLAKFVAVLAAVAGPALAQPSANVIDVAPPADPAAVVVLRGSSAPPQPWGGPPAPQPSSTPALSTPPPPAPTYVEQAYVPLYVLPGYIQATPQRAPPAPQAGPAYPIRPWGVGLAPFQR